MSQKLIVSTLFCQMDFELCLSCWLIYNRYIPLELSLYDDFEDELSQILFLRGFL